MIEISGKEASPIVKEKKQNSLLSVGKDKSKTQGIIELDEMSGASNGCSISLS